MLFNMSINQCDVTVTGISSFSKKGLTTPAIETLHQIGNLRAVDRSLMYGSCCGFLDSSGICSFVYLKLDFPYLSVAGLL